MQQQQESGKIQLSAGAQFKQQRQQMKKKGKKAAKERQYHDIEISKLAKAFEDQFFKHFALITQSRNNGQKQMYQADELTVTKGKDKYDSCKITTFTAVARLQLYLWVWLFLSVIAFIALLIDIIENDDPKSQLGPFLVQIAQLIIKGNQVPKHQAFATLLYVLTTFFFLLALFQFIAGRYLAIICTVSSSKRVANFLKYIAYIICGTMSLSTLFTIGYLIKFPGVCVLAVFIHVMWMCAVGILLYKTVT